MSLGDSSWELVDPTPNVYVLFEQFDKTFFWGALNGRTAVRWSRRMYSCAGTCSYSGSKGLCDIALSEPLLKLRHRKDLLETLLHEMIHAYLFIIGDKDEWRRDGHGPTFQGHMHRINKQTGLNITIYHTFHDEVRLYKTHWWRCNGPCQTQKPFFGIVRRSSNRAPGPNDFWWNEHKLRCGGNFIKTKEPEKKTSKKSTVAKPKENIKKFIDTTKRSPSSNIGNKPKDNNNSPVRKILVNINSPKIINTSLDDNVREKVRNIWQAKDLNNKQNIKKKEKTAIKRNGDHVFQGSPSPKVKKVSDYFEKDTQTPDVKLISNDVAISILSDVYKDEIKNNGVTISPIMKKLTKDIVNCPICNVEIPNKDINSHVDECLNKDEIARLCGESDITIEHNNKDYNANNTKVIDENYTNIKQANKRKSHIVEPQPSTSHKTDVDYIDLTDDSVNKKGQTCPCCSKIIKMSVEEHLDECVSFIVDEKNEVNEKETTIKTDFGDIVVSTDDFEDEFDETTVFNETGTKHPCPCCLTMVEQVDMNRHLDICLQS